MPAPKGTPHKKPTREEKNQIQSQVSGLLAKGVLAGQVKKTIANKHGLKPRSVEPYIRHAREEMRESSGKDDEDHRSDAYCFYNSILIDSTASHRDKLKARERIDKLLGLDKPTVVHGKNVNIDLTPEQLEDMSDDELANLESRLLN